MDEPPPPPTKEELQERLARARAGRGARATKSRATNTRTARRWVLAIAILQVLAGLVLGFTHQAKADQAVAHLAANEDDEVMQLQDGGTATAGELRRAIARERVQVFVVPIGLGVVFLLLFLWAKRAPVPAIGTALALYVTAHLLTAIVDPTEIAKGIILKVLCILGLARGLKSALQERALQESESADATA